MGEPQRVSILSTMKWTQSDGGFSKIFILLNFTVLVLFLKKNHDLFSETKM